MRRTSTSATTPKPANTMATVKGSQALPPVSGSESAGAEAEAFALAEALAVALAVAPVLALSCTRRTRKLEIEKDQPWQSYLETAWGVQRRMAEHYFAKTEDWTGLIREHDRWMHDYNVQEHHAHQHRKEGRRSPSGVLAWVKTPRYQEEDLERAFFSARYTRTLDDLGYLTLQRYRLYGEEGWVKFLKLDEYAPRQRRRLDKLQQVLFA